MHVMDILSLFVILTGIAVRVEYKAAFDAKERKNSVYTASDCILRTIHPKLSNHLPNAYADRSRRSAA